MLFKRSLLPIIIATAITTGLMGGVVPAGATQPTMDSQESLGTIQPPSLIADLDPTTEELENSVETETENEILVSPPVVVDDSPTITVPDFSEIPSDSGIRPAFTPTGGTPAANLLHLLKGAGVSAPATETDLVRTVNNRLWVGTSGRVFVVDSGVSVVGGFELAQYGPFPIQGEFPRLVDPGWGFDGGDGHDFDCKGRPVLSHGDVVASKIMDVAPGARIVSVQITGCDSPSATVADFNAGLDWVITQAQPGDVVNISYSQMQLFAAKLNTITAKGALVLVAGNNVDGSNLCTNPTGTDPSTDFTAAWSSIQGLVVGAAYTGSRTRQGAVGSCIEVTAPTGLGVSGAGTFGQSLATGYASGVAISYWAANPTVTVSQITGLMVTGALGVNGAVDGTPDRLLRIVSPPSGPILDPIVEEGPGDLRISWATPLVGVPTGYQVTLNGVVVCSVPETAFFCEYAGLSVGSHTLQIRASSAVGWGQYAGWIANPAKPSVLIPADFLAVTTSGPALAPTAVTSTPAAGSAVIAWSATQAGTPNTGFVIERYANGLWSAIATVAASPVTVPANAAPAQIRVRAINKWGQSPASAIVSVVASSTQPGGGSNSGGSPSIGGGSGAGSSSPAIGGGSSSGGSSAASSGGARQEITQVSPSAGSFQGGNLVSLIGYGFAPVTKVSVGGVSVPFKIVNDAHIELTMPAGALGSRVDIEAFISAASGRAIATTAYLYQADSIQVPTLETSPPAVLTPVVKGIRKISKSGLQRIRVSGVPEGANVTIRPSTKNLKFGAVKYIKNGNAAGVAVLKISKRHQAFKGAWMVVVKTPTQTWEGRIK